MQFEITLQYTPVARKRPSLLRQLFRKILGSFLHSLIAGHVWPAYFIIRQVSEKILVFFLVRFGIITYLCIRTSPRCPGADGGGTSLEIYNKRLLLFGIASRTWEIRKSPNRRISRRRSCIVHGRDLSGLVGNSQGLWSMGDNRPCILCALMPASEDKQYA